METVFYSNFDIESLAFPRYIKPSGSFLKDPNLIMFDDGSNGAYGANAYIRWQTNDCEYDACPVAAKNQLAPL